MKEVNLPSGSVLNIVEAPFADSKELHQILLSELKSVRAEGLEKVDKNFIKEAIFITLSSKKIEAALNKCLIRCTVDGEKLTLDYFEKPEKREDYVPAIQEILMVNIAPFLNGLFALLKVLIEKIPSVPA